MENHDHNKAMGWCYISGSLALIATLGFLFAGCNIAATFTAIILLLSGLAAKLINLEFAQYRRSEELLMHRSMREKLKYILRRPRIAELYLHYGTAENFNDFRAFFLGLSKYDDLRDDIEPFLAKAEKAGKFENKK